MHFFSSAAGSAASSMARTVNQAAVQSEVSMPAPTRESTGSRYRVFTHDIETDIGYGIKIIAVHAGTRVGGKCIVNGKDYTNLATTEDELPSDSPFRR